MNIVSVTTDNQPIIECNACGGTGKVKLSGISLEVFRDVQQHGNVCAQDVFGRMQKPDCGVTAINNRLELLRRLGLLSRDRVGKNYLYSLTTTPTP